MDLRDRTFAAFTAEVVLTAQIVHIVVVHHVDSSNALSGFWFLILTAAPL